MARLTKAEIKQGGGITKKAWRIHNAKKTKSKFNKPKRRSSTRVGRYMAKRKRRSGGKSITQQAFKWLRIGALVAPGAAQVLRGGSNELKINRVLQRYTGVWLPTGTFDWSKLAEGWLPYVATCAITHGVGKLNGIIRKL